MVDISKDRHTLLLNPICFEKGILADEKGLPSVLYRRDGRDAHTIG
jgi:hypothetical protein